MINTYVSVKSKLQHAPPGIPRAFDTFAVPGRREFDYQSLPGGGEFELHPRFHVKSLAWRAMWDAVFVEKIVSLWPIGYEERAYTRFAAYLKNSNFKIFNIGFRL